MVCVYNGGEMPLPQQAKLSHVMLVWSWLCWARRCWVRGLGWVGLAGWWGGGKSCPGRGPGWDRDDVEVEMEYVGLMSQRPIQFINGRGTA